MILISIKVPVSDEIDSIELWGFGRGFNLLLKLVFA
jgi:hypothetical protein